jgi:hypothetical protein
MKLAIVTPTRDGLVDINYATSVIGLIKIAEGWEIEPTMISGASDITSARNALFNTWYYSTDVEVFMFVDSDISFDPKAILPWLDMDVEVISATYPKKFFNHHGFLHVASLFQQETGQINIDQAIRASYDYTSTGHHNLITDGPKKGLMTVGGNGMGCFMIRRSAADKLMEWAKENMEESTFSTLNDKKPQPGYAVFNHVRGEDGSNWGEDFSFCHRLREAGVDIHLDPAVSIRHVGHTGFDGEFIAVLELLKLKENNPEITLPESNLLLKKRD